MRRSGVRVPISVRHDVAVGVTSSHDKESSTTTVTAHRWCVLAVRTTTSASKALSTGKKLRVRSDYVMQVRRRVGGATIVPNDLPGHHGDEAPRRKQTLGSCCARVSSALRVFRPAIVSVVASGVSSTLRVVITTSSEVRAGWRLCVESEATTCTFRKGVERRQDFFSHFG